MKNLNRPLTLDGNNVCYVITSDNPDVLSYLDTHMQKLERLFPIKIVRAKPNTGQLNLFTLQDEEELSEK